jgi:catechol 2,3-dioxygenase-like lactoylglutathione lyase family enzyme
VAELPAPQEGILLTHFVVAEDVERSRAFYANSWIIINVGGGPTDDKPRVVLETPPDPNRVSAFLNIRVADIHGTYEEWSSRGAEFLTPPIDHEREIRCYMRDPDGHLIEIGQTTATAG